MKRTYFNPSSFAAKMPIRRTRLGFACYKTDGGSGGDDKDDEDAKKQLLIEVRAAAKAELKNDTLYKEFETMSEAWKKFPVDNVRALCDDKTGVIARFAAIDAKMIELEQRAAASGGKELTLRGQIEKWQKDNKESLDGIRNKKKMNLEALEIRVANVPMLPSNTYVAGSVLPVPFYESTISDPVRPQPTFWDMLTKGSTDQSAYGWINKTNVQGAAGFVGPGVLKPAISFQLDTNISNYKKIAVTDKVAVELLWDVKGMETLIKDEIRYQILIKLNSALITNVGSATEPTGITNLSVAYTQTGIVTDNPTYMDALRAAVAQLRNGNIQGEITILINPVDSANMDMAKATDSGVYMLPSFVSANGKNISGATVIEDASIPVGSFLAGFLRYYRVLIFKPLFITFGWEMDDFTKNLITYLGEMAIHQFFNEQYTGAFIYDTFANVLAAIETPVIP